MGRMFVLPYKMASEGGKMLADGLEGLRIKLQDSQYRYQEGDTIVNWGTGSSHGYVPIAAITADCILNPDVNICINKKMFFERMQGHNIVPPFAFSRDEARRHLQYPIICRTQVEGADGQGIMIAEDENALLSTIPACRLYTQLLTKTAEYRVHMGRRFDGEIVLIAAQRKRMGEFHPGPIWTGEHVFLDVIEPHELPRHVFDVTKCSMELMPELHFGGFDTIDTAANGARVVEVNSAPMMTPYTTGKYVEFIKQYVADRDTSAITAAIEEDPTETPEYQQGYAAALSEMRNRIWDLFDQREEG
jgi:hypothetical protein